MRTDNGGMALNVLAIVALVLALAGVFITPAEVGRGEGREEPMVQKIDRCINSGGSFEMCYDHLTQHTQK